MGIPLPALSIQAPPQPDIAGNLERLMALKSMMGQQQMQQQEIALAQQKVQDQKAVMSDIQQNPGSTLADSAERLKGKISLPAYTNLIDTDAAIRQKHAAATDAELGNFQKVHDQQQRIYSNVAGLSDEDLAKQWPTIAQQFNSIPGNNAKVDPNQPLTQQQLKDHAIPLGLQEAYLKQEADKRKEQAETEEATQKGEASKAEAEKTRAETQGFVGPFAEARYRNILSSMSAGKPVSDDDLTFAKGFEAASKKTTTQSDTLGVTSTSTSGPAGLASVGNRQGGKFVAPGSAVAPAQGATPPAAPRAVAPSGAAPSAQATKNSIVDLIGHYQANPTLLARMMTKHPDIIGQVHLQYPDWDETTYNAKNKIIQSYTSGPESKSINAISTALGHAGELGQAIEALGNGDAGLKTLRGLAQKAGIQLGTDAGSNVAAFKTIVHRLAPEIAAAYIQGGGGEGERVSNAEDFDPALAHKILQGNLSETVKLLRSKISAQEQQWNNTYKPTRPEDDFSTRFLTPQAKDALQKFSPQAGGGGGGATGKIYTQSDVDAAVKAHPGMTSSQIDAAFKAKGYTKQ